MTSPPFMPWYPSDYLADTMHLDHRANSVYRDLLDHSWLRGGKLPDDDNLLAGLTRCTLEEWQKLRPTVEKFFRVTHGVWRQKRLSKEYKSASKAHQKMREGGQKGAATRWAHKIKTKNTPANDHANSPDTGLPNGQVVARARVPEPEPEPEILPPQPPLVNEGGRRARRLKKSPRTVQMEAFAYAAAQRTARTSDC